MMIGIQISPPSDGWNSIERAILREMIARAYRAIEDPTNRFIFMALTECDYTQEEVGLMIGISQVAVQKRFIETREYLKTIRGEFGYNSDENDIPS